MVNEDKLERTGGPRQNLGASGPRTTVSVEAWTSRVFTRKSAPPPLAAIFHENWAKNKNAPPTGRHVLSTIWTILELFHDDWAKIVTSRVFKRKTALPTGDNVF
ncbi:hypothetical protein DPMN_042604 [Dreissena polymorpha]|uniref:Uncharacterized protein n=1 Tax=Dreissena polymorpha TaxID=45954 RepID=A0A9D4HX22_DREPO|nr:hypothetical protein DPMN_042604 [Dreissena polymorpha]